MSWICAWIGRSSARLSSNKFFPSYQISPAVGSSRRTRQRASVDFPEPDSPTRANVVPRAIVRSTPSTAGTTNLLRESHRRCSKNLRRPLTRSSVEATSGEVCSAAIFETPHPARCFGLYFFGSAGGADGQAIRATRLKGTTRRQTRRVWRATGDCRQLGLPRRGTFVGSPGHRSQQPLCIRMQRRAVHPLKGALFDDASGIHHQDAVGEPRENGGIVTDQKENEPPSLLLVLDQRQGFGLGGWIQRGRGLLGNPPRRPARQRLG